MVTICTLEHGCYFGKYPELKCIVEEEMKNIKNYFLNVSIDKSVVMPNHVHIIISINFKVNGVTLGKIINVFKGKTINRWLKTIKQEKINAIGCIWQRNYFERRIRNIEELKKYKRYIEINPINWKHDFYNPINLECRGFASRSP